MALNSNPPLGTIPGARGWPLIGNLPSLLPNPMPFIEAQHRRHGNVFFASFAMNQRAVFLLGPEAAELVLVDRKQIFSSKLAYADQARFLGEHFLLFRDGKEHLALRRRLNPAFRPAALKSYLEIMNEHIAERASRWATATQPRLAEEIRQLTLDIAVEAIAGAEVGPESDGFIRHFIHMLGASDESRASPARDGEVEGCQGSGPYGPLLQATDP